MGMMPEMSSSQVNWDISVFVIKNYGSLLLEKQRIFLLVNEQSSPSLTESSLYFVGVHVFKKHSSNLAATELVSILGKTNLGSAVPLDFF